MIQQQDRTFEQLNIERMREKALGSGKIRVWLTLLKAYEENQLFEQKDEAIVQMHKRFILKQSFWIRQIERKFNESSLKPETIQFCLLSLDDDLYLDAGKLIYKRLLKQLNSQHRNHRQTFIIAKLQQIFSFFQSTYNFFPGLRRYFLKKGNIKKAKDLYFREIANGYDDIDIIYDQYKLIQKNQDELSKVFLLYQKGKEEWENKESKNQSSKQIIDPDGSLFESTRAFKAIESLSSQSKKLYYLRRICLMKHELIFQYLEKIQKFYFEDDQTILDTYKNMMIIAPDVQFPYLWYLIRRINKHVQGTQPQEYSQSWSANVQFFRTEIAELIAKPGLTPKTEESMRQNLYRLWIEVETSLVKDKESVCQLCESLLRLKRTVTNYHKYSKYLIRLGYIADAKQVLKRCIQSFKYDYDAHKHYQNFISIYGTIEDFIELRKIKTSQKTERKEQQLKMNSQIMINNQENINPYNNHQNGKSSISKQNQQKEVNKSIVNSQRQMMSEKRERNACQQKQQQENVPKKKIHLDGGNTLYIRGLPEVYDEQFVRELITNKHAIHQIRLISKHGSLQNYCYIEMKSKADAAQELEENKYKDKYRIALSKPPEAFTQRNTLFLCALPDSVNVDKIKQLFEEWKKHILDVRIKHKDEKILGFVDFEGVQIKNQVLEKVKKSKPEIDGKKVIVMASKSESFTHHKKQNRVIVLKNLGFKVNERDIHNYFPGKSIEDVFIPVNNEGKSKGVGFVKFSNRTDFYQALDMREGELKGRKFYIDKSSRDIERPKQTTRGNKFFQSLIS